MLDRCKRLISYGSKIPTTLARQHYSFRNSHVTPFKVINNLAYYNTSSSPYYGNSPSKEYNFSLEDSVDLDLNKWKILPEAATDKPIFFYPGFFTKNELVKHPNGFGVFQLHMEKIAA